LAKPVGRTGAQGNRQFAVIRHTVAYFFLTAWKPNGYKILR
jgi:hypothetical protein